jgi:hypothetical protein
VSAGPCQLRHFERALVQLVAELVQRAGLGLMGGSKVIHQCQSVCRCSEDTSKRSSALALAWWVRAKRKWCVRRRSVCQKTKASGGGVAKGRRGRRRGRRRTRVRLNWRRLRGIKRRGRTKMMRGRGRRMRRRRRERGGGGEEGDEVYFSL